MNINTNLEPDSFPKWMLVSYKQLPEDWLTLPKRTLMTGEREQILTSKLCTKCKDDKPFTEFWVLKSGVHDSWCKACRNFTKKERMKLKRGIV